MEEGVRCGQAVPFRLIAAESACQSSECGTFINLIPNICVWGKLAPRLTVHHFIGAIFYDRMHGGGAKHIGSWTVYTLVKWIKPIYDSDQGYSSVARSLKLRLVDLGWYLDGWPPWKARTVNLGPFVVVDLNLWPNIYIAVMVLTRTYNESKQTLHLTNLGHWCVHLRRAYRAIT